MADQKRQMAVRGTQVRYRWSIALARVQVEMNNFKPAMPWVSPKASPACTAVSNAHSGEIALPSTAPFSLSMTVQFSHKGIVRSSLPFQPLLWR